MDFQVTLIRDLNQLITGNYAVRYEQFVESLSGYHRLSYSTQWLKIIAPLFIQRNDGIFFVLALLGQRIVAMAPFYLEQHGRGVFSFRQLHLWGKGNGYMDYPLASMISLEEYKEQSIECIVNSLKTSYQDDFDEINLTRVDPTDSFIQQLCSTFKVSANTDHGDQQHFFVNGQLIDDKLKGENLRRIKKAAERLTQDFVEVEFSCQTTVDDSLLEEIRQLHIRRQKDVMNEGRSRISIFEDPVECEVTNSLFNFNQSINAMRTYTLRLDGRLAGFWVCFHYNGYTQAYLTAFIPVPEHKYAAACLWRYMYKEEVERFGTQTIDSGFGTHNLKRKFCNHLVNLRSFMLQNQYSLFSRARQSMMYAMRQSRKIYRSMRR